MKNLLVLVLSYVACTIVHSESEAFQKLNLESEKCESACAAKPLAYEGIALKSCSRGCRLFGICEWISSNLSETTANCKSSCNDSYTNAKNLFEACSIGCDAAVPLAIHRHNQMANQAVLLKTSHNLFPSRKNEDPFSELFSVKNDLDSGFGLNDMMNNMMASALKSFNMMQNFMSFDAAHHTEIFDIIDGDREEIIVLQYANPVINTPNPSDKKITLNTGRNWFKTTLRDYIETNLQTNVNKKAGLPELVLFLFWVSVSIILAFTCFVQFRSAPKLSVNGDLAFITDNKGSLPSYMEPYPVPQCAKESPYFLASVKLHDEKVPLPESAFVN